MPPILERPASDLLRTVVLEVGAADSAILSGEARDVMDILLGKAVGIAVEPGATLTAQIEEAIGLGDGLA